MTPFIIWLNKGEIDELLATLVTKKTSQEIKNCILNTDDLVELSQKLMEQNSKLVKMIEKIEPINPINKKATYVHGINQKCEHYIEQLKKMSTHCSVFNDKLENKFNEFSEAICKDCSRKKDSFFSTN